MKKAVWAAPMLMLLLSLTPCAQAVREGVVEDAPMIELREAVSYLPRVRQEKAETGWMLEEAYTEIDTTQMLYADIRACLTSSCRLTAGERKRMDKLMAAYAAGKRTGDGASVLEAEKNVRVGVYALDPTEYDGERVLLLLPGNCLTDEEMLAILDAYHTLGETFDPDALNERNCVRGSMYLRSLTAEDEERWASLKAQVERGILKREDVPRTLKAVEVDETAVLGSQNGKFIFTPYRRLTDDELLDDMFLSGIQNECKGIDIDAAERNARLALREKHGCPLSMKLMSLHAYDDYGQAGGHWGRMRYISLSFEYTDENDVRWSAHASVLGVNSQVTETDVSSY